LASATYYLPGSILRDEDALVAKHLTKVRRMRIGDVRRVTALPVPSIIDEVGLVLEDKSGNRIWLRETDLHFHWLTRRLNADVLLGGDWYPRAETGEHLSAEIPR
jgi:hypothetical protein